MVEDELVVDLEVVVGVIVVVVDVRAVGQYVRTVGGYVLAVGVVAASVELHLLFRGARVGEVGPGLAAEREELDHRVAAVVGSLQHVGFQVGGAAVHVAVRADVRQARVDHPMAAHEARTDVDRLLVGVVRAVRERGVAAELGAERRRGHVDRTAESARAVGRGAGAALHLHVAHGRNEVRRVVEVGRMRVGVVQRYAVGRNVQAGGVRAAHAHRGGTHAHARFGGGDHRGGRRQHERYVEAVVVFLDRFARDVGIGHRSFLRGARGGYFDLLEIVHAQRILFGVLGACIQSVRAAERRECEEGKDPFHVTFLMVKELKRGMCY